MKSYTGGCSCKAIWYEVTAEPLQMVQCQCRDCQESTGSGHASALVFPKKAVKLFGNPTYYATQADSGNTKRRAFCSICGSPLYTLLDGMPDLFAIKVGSLDDPSIFQPQIVLYTDSGHAWDMINSQLPSYPKMPSTV
jgi:hypothetical protein